MRYLERPPIDELKPYIKCVWHLNRTYTGQDDSEVLWPDGCMELIFHFGASYRVNGQPLPPSFFIGTLSHYHHLQADGHIRLFGIRLLPWGLKAFTNSNTGSCKDRFTPMTELWDENAIRKLESTLASPSVDEGLQAVQDFLLPYLESMQVNPSMLLILSKLYNSPMEYGVPTAAAESGYSQRQFERICSDMVGMSAKQLSKAARFNQARLRIFKDPMIDLHQCMLDFGYYDYAHFSKDFKQCLGITPADYKKWMLQIYERMNKSKRVVFLQDK